VYKPDNKIAKAIKSALGNTQKLLLTALSQNGYQGQIVLFNGTNSDALSKAIYTAWVDRRKGLKAELKEYDEQIAALKKEARCAGSLPDKLAMQKKLRDLDKKRDTAWKEYDEAAKQIERQKDRLLDTVEERLKQTVEESMIFSVRWELR
jgi:predicted  nucleic acid-binding Zn-ribbon protein